MAEYICREAILEDLEKEIEAGNIALDEDVWVNKGLRIAIRDIKDIKTADVQPVKRGRWIWSSSPEFGNPYGSYICSECESRQAYRENFCPDCGARMDE